MTKQILTQEYLKSILHYSIISGKFYWIKPVRYGLNGKQAGCTNNSKKYRLIVIQRKSYKAHRLAFLYLFGDVPVQIDHKNHIRDDNRFLNIRAASAAINSKNMSLHTRNKSGYHGVHESKSGSWNAVIRNEHIGAFNTKEKAIKARKLKEIEYGFHENHGK